MDCPKDCSCGKKKFIPNKKPRVSPYSFGKAQCENDLRFYNIHRRNVFYAKPKVDTTAPSLSIKKYLDYISLWKDANRLDEIDRKNKLFMQRLIALSRLGGTVDHVNTNVYSSRISNWRGMKDRMRSINKENRAIMDRLCRAESQYQKLKYDQQWKLTLETLRNSCKFPCKIGEKERYDFLKTGPSISHILSEPHLDRRFKCFLDFQVEDGEYLGQIVVELYHDHLPVTVDNFFQICRGAYGLSYANCPVHRIVKDKFLESGDIVKGTGSRGMSIYGKSFDEENHILQHTRAGVLTMSRVGQQQNDSRFCITFRDMHEWDRKNVVFGKVISGGHVLEKINGYGRKIGKPLRPVYISRCGELPYCDCRVKTHNSE